MPISLASPSVEPVVGTTSSGEDDHVAGDQRATWAHDGGTLGELGQARFSPRPQVTVQLPGELARCAVLAWDRDDTAVVESETPAEALMRKRVSARALIG